MIAVAISINGRHHDRLNSSITNTNHYDTNIDKKEEEEKKKNCNIEIKRTMAIVTVNYFKMQKQKTKQETVTKVRLAITKIFNNGHDRGNGNHNDDAGPRMIIVHVL